MTTNTAEPITNVVEKVDSTQAIDFGSGRYSPLAFESFKAAKTVFRLEERKAAKLARQIASDFGAAMRDVQVTARLSKSINSDGKVTLAEASKIKATQTDALGAMRALQFASEASKAGFNYGETKWTVSEKLSEYFDTL